MYHFKIYHENMHFHLITITDVVNISYKLSNVEQLIVSHCKFLSPVQHKNTSIFQRATISITLFVNIKTYIPLLYPWSIQISRSAFAIMNIKCQLPCSEASLSSQGNIDFFSVIINSFSQIQNKINTYCHYNL